jgi:uncharacterized protein YggE
MRLVVLGAALALGLAIPASAETPVSVQPLASGEVLLEVNALAYVTSRADRATLSVLVTAEGADAPAARRATEARLARVVAAVRAAGIAADDIDAGRVTTSAAYPLMTADMAMTSVATRAATDPEPTRTATGNATLTITIRNVERVEPVRDVLAANEVESYQPPDYRLVENSAQRREARLQAMRKARADAESYAAGMNMRIVRVVRVTERLGLGGLGLIASEADTVGNLFSRSWRRSPEVDTIVTVGVDFALAPL